jgi:hypothetical protein
VLEPRKLLHLCSLARQHRGCLCLGVRTRGTCGAQLASDGSEAGGACLGLSYAQPLHML